jgi:hypothetical protein
MTKESDALIEDSNLNMITLLKRGLYFLYFLLKDRFPMKKKKKTTSLACQAMEHWKENEQMHLKKICE